MNDVFQFSIHKVPCSAIYIARDQRQRTVISTDDLDESIRTRGVMNPLIVREITPSEENGHRTMLLVAGERRLTSCLKVGRKEVPVRFTTEISNIDLQIIELEENVKREALEWQDEVRALDRIHQLLSEINGEDWSISATARHIGFDNGNLSRALRVARDIDSTRITGAGGIRAAWNILTRLDERRNSDIINSLVEDGIGAFLPSPGAGDEPANGAPPSSPDPSLPSVPAGSASPMGNSSVVADPFAFGSSPAASPSPAPAVNLPVPSDPILNIDFLEWVGKYSGPRFNFIHMDPPYGINVFGGNMSGRKAHDTYDDAPDVYWTILKALCDNLDNIMTPAGHLMLWFSMEHYTETLEFFREHAPSLNFSKFPIIWHKTDNVGILTDPKRGPRRIYETALIASREDHLIVRAVSNIYGCPTDKTYHPSTKPEPMLRHFFQMFVDETTRILDPTCGSGSALRAAESLNASEVLGLEKDPIHHAAAVSALRSFRNLRKASR